MFGNYDWHIYFINWLTISSAHNLNAKKKEEIKNYSIAVGLINFRPNSSFYNRVALMLSI